MTQILAIIPARAGSKGVKNKNIRQLNGKPLLAYSIEHALASEVINRVIVSTDSEEYAAIAKSYNAEVPFIRPKDISGDLSLDIEVFQHALKYLEENEGYIPDVVVQLRPTYPIREIKDIEKMVNILLDDELLDSVRCITPVKELAYKMWRMDESNQITPVLSDIKEAYNMPRQVLPTLYYQNACIDVIRTNVITEKNSMSGTNIKGYIVEQNFDIDTEEEFHRAEQYLSLMAGNKRFIFDIDGVIANFRGDLDYNNAEPNKVMIEIINKLYELGNYIVLFTARGYVTNIDWTTTTKSQMENWGVKFHELKFGKPNADFYIDDKMLDVNILYRYLK